MDKDNLKHRLPEELRCFSTEFYVTANSVSCKGGKNVLKTKKTVGKKNLNSVKEVPIVHIMFIITIIIVSEKKNWRHCFLLTYVNNKI